MVKWYDTTSFSRGSRDRTPRVWQAKIGSFGLSVHRHTDWPTDQWMATCDPLFRNFELASKDAEEAKCQAVAKLQVMCEEAIQVICRKRHYHVAGDGDTCQECGEDLRSDVHLRAGEAS